VALYSRFTFGDSVDEIGQATNSSDTGGETVKNLEANTETNKRRKTAVKPAGFFSVLNTESKAEFYRSSRPLKLCPGEPLFHQESEHSLTFIIQSGLIRTFYVSEVGREVTLGYWSAGDVVGGPGLFGGGQHVWSAVAYRRSEVLAISGPNLRNLAESNIKVMNWIIKVLEFKLRWLSVLFQIHGTEHVHDRLAKLLLMMGNLYGDEVDGAVVIKHRISQTDLATLVGASRQWTNKALAKLRDEGVISMDGRRILLHDPKALRNTLEKVR
jgi:CRP/FNR family cyclic AMP-dependent transcriptional regulator